MKHSDILPYAAPVLKLLQGVLTDADENDWNKLLNFQQETRVYLQQIGLELTINEIDGYAFLKQPRIDDEEQPIDLPTLTSRHRLSPLDTSLLLLLREWLYEHETRLTEDNRLFVKYEDMQDALLGFWKPQGNAKTQDNRIRITINRIENMGFIKKNDAKIYRVYAVIKHKIDSNRLQAIRDNLSAYYAQERDDDDAE